MGRVLEHRRVDKPLQSAPKDTIPAFVDNDYQEADQVIENLQRNELTACEVAGFIGRELAKGISKTVKPGSSVVY